MGKRKKKVSKKKQKVFGKTQFIDIICKSCGVCANYNPTFCYDWYREDAETFLQVCYTKLLDLRRWMDENSLTPDFVPATKFREVFCYSKICGEVPITSCENGIECFANFRSQVMGYNSKRFGKVKKNKKRKEPEVFEAYATFFISSNKEFQKEVEGILNDGSRDIQ